VVRKFFALDKNYLLEEAQLLLRDTLLKSLVESVKLRYENLYNPLGLADSLSIRIRNYKPEDLKPLEAFYLNLAGIYRYKHGENQLAFIWDGVDQSEKYKKEWSAFFADHVNTFCKNDLFIRAVLDLTVFNTPSAQLVENRMNNFMLQTFEVKLRNGFIKVA